MFNLIRRISYSVIPRPDRPWAEDATSNAPTKGKKRRLSTTEREMDADADESSLRKKKIRGELPDLEGRTESEVPSSPAPETPVDTTGVKEVTKGVKEVDLSKSDQPATDIAPETVPLPGEDDLAELETPISPSLSAAADTVEEDIASSDNGESVAPDVVGDAVSDVPPGSTTEEQAKPAVEEENKTDDTFPEAPRTEPVTETKTEPVVETKEDDAEP
ncbi:hypothetical protein H0H92_001784 [Tricholoma furcatifolium]|nr:hypothetical protein H0H92_001784 [Tricholoma furcatifolium]